MALLLRCFSAAFTPHAGVLACLSWRVLLVCHRLTSPLSSRRAKPLTTTALRTLGRHLLLVWRARLFRFTVQTKQVWVFVVGGERGHHYRHNPRHKPVTCSGTFHEVPELIIVLVSLCLVVFSVPPVTSVFLPCVFPGPL